MEDSSDLLAQAQLVASRLERISADSIWARRSSGHRGALLRMIENGGEGCLSPAEREQLTALIELGYLFLERAARERLR